MKLKVIRAKTEFIVNKSMKYVLFLQSGDVVKSSFVPLHWFAPIYHCPFIIFPNWFLYLITTVCFLALDLLLEALSYYTRKCYTASVLYSLGYYLYFTVRYTSFFTCCKFLSLSSFSQCYTFILYHLLVSLLTSPNLTKAVNATLQLITHVISHLPLIGGTHLI